MSGYGTRRFALIALFIIPIGLFLCLNCAPRSKEKSERAIGEVLALREQAMEGKDIDLYMRCISEAYQDGNETYTSIRERMQRNFRAFERIDFSQFNRTVYPEGDSATVVQEYEIGFVFEGRRDYVKGKEKILFKRNPGGWKIVKGI
ncbi:MAG: YybH family protein [bacterium]